METPLIPTASATSKGSRLFECGVVYFFLAFINLRVKLTITESWFDGTLASNHQQLLAFDYTNNEQSRLAQFGIPEIISRLSGCQIESAYIAQRLLFVFAAFVAFHLYLRKWFDERTCFLTVVLLAALMPLVYMDHLQESAALLMLTFLLILWAIREHRTKTYAALLLLGAVNNETVLILPAVFFFYNWNVGDVRSAFRTMSLAVLTAAPAYGYTAMIRYVTRDNPHLGGAWHLPDNLYYMLSDAGMYPIDFWRATHLYIFFLYGAFWLWAFVDYRKKPLFLRRASLVIPLFVLAHLITGKIAEPRQMIPLAYLLLPMGIMTIFPECLVRENSDQLPSQTS